MMCAKRPTLSYFCSTIHFLSIVALGACQPPSPSQTFMEKPGGPFAQEISLPNPAGQVLRLSDLRGQYVLLDFWAAWCGPCRQENTHLVAAYQRFKAANFTVFSVSLDHQPEAWQQAIVQDKLEWPHHVSDLKGWDNQAALAYGIEAIPMNFLLDPQGRIIARNLRGPVLEAQLNQILKP
ncbi:MAG: TlpA family protein disulfide reductase [Microscillaceae bacterium]|nr:TlpA family protein disulfide reductase [Microscillaceae bacterium]